MQVATATSGFRTLPLCVIKPISAAASAEQRETTAEYRVSAKSLYDCFHDVNGENLFEAILALCAVARDNERLITFM